MRLTPSAVAACFAARLRDERYLPQVFRFHLIPTPPAETGAALHAEKAVTASGAEIGSTVSEQAVIIAGWLADRREGELVLAEDPDENILTFRYTKAPETISYTVYYLRADDNTPVHEPVTRTVSGDTAIAYEFAAKIAEANG